MLNQKDSEDLILLNFPEILQGKKDIKNFSQLLARETNSAMKFGIVERAKNILSFTHYLFFHSSRYVQLLLIDQYYKKLNCIHCQLNFGQFLQQNKLREDHDHLPLKISYRLRNFDHQLQLTLITIK